MVKARKKNHTLTDQEKIDCVSEYLADTSMTVKWLADKYNLSRSAMYGVLTRRGVAIRNDMSKITRKYELDETYFQKIDTPEKAYFLGFLYADAYCCSDVGYVVINLQERDVDILEKLRDALKSNYKITFVKKANENCQNQRRLRFCGWRITQDLVDLGCVQNKSLILEFPTEEQVPKIFWRDFLRGYTDGDGYLGFSPTKGTVLDWTIASSKTFCEKVQEILIQKFGIKGHMRQGKNDGPKTRHLTVNSVVNAAKVMKWLYEDATVFLDRKMSKFLEIKEYCKKENNLAKCKIVKSNGERFYKKENKWPMAGGSPGKRCKNYSEALSYINEHLLKVNPEGVKNGLYQIIHP